MTLPLIRRLFFIWTVAVSVTVVLLLSGCSDGDSTTATPDTSPAALETENSGPPAYPLDICVVSRDKLGSMGEVYEVEVEGRTFKLCCAGCEDQLRADPAKYLAILDNAAANANDNPNTHGHGHDQHDHL